MVSTNVQKAARRPTKTDILAKNQNLIRDLYGLNRLNKAPLSTGTVGSLGGVPSASGQSGGVGNFLRTQGDTMIGPIAFFPVVLSIDITDAIDIGQASGTANIPDYSSFAFVSGGPTNDLELIKGAAFSGQYLILEFTLTEVITLEDFSNNVGGNILTPTGNNIILDNTAARQIVTLIFDVTASPNGNTGGWRVMTVSTTAVSGSVNAGTAENDHLEWNNTTSIWEAFQTLQFNATGPHGDSGFLRFKNADIMLSQRNAANTGNIELKFTSTDALDVTESNNSPARFVVRTQHPSDLDNTIELTTGSGAAADTLIDASTIKLLIGVGGFNRLELDTATATSLLLRTQSAVTQTANFDIRSSHISDPDNTLAFSMGSGASATALIDGSTPLLKIGVGGANRLDFDVSTTTSLLLHTPSGVTATADFNIRSSHISDPDNTLSLSVGSGIGADTLISWPAATLKLQPGGNTRFELTDDTFRKVNLDNTEPHIELFRNDSTPTAASIVGHLDFFGRDLTPATVEYMSIQGLSSAVTAGSAEGGMQWLFLRSGVPASRLAMDANDNFVLQAGTSLGLESVLGELGNINKNETELNINTTDRIFFQVGGVTEFEMNATTFDMRGNDAINFDFMEFNERVGDPTVGVDAGVIYVKDVAGNSRLFFDNSTEVPIELGAGGGVTFPIKPPVDVRGTVTTAQAVDISQTDGHVTTMTLGADVTVTFSGFPATGNQQTWELHVSQDGVGGRTLTVSPTPVESFTIANGANTLTILTFLTNDGGTDIHVVPSLRGTVSLSGSFLPLAGGTMSGDIVMGTNSITGINDLTFTDDATQPASTVTFLAKTVTELNYNVPVNDLHNFRVVGTSEMTINATTIDFQGNSVIDGILGVTITGISGITGLGTQGQNLVMGNFNITGISDLVFTEAGTQIQATVGGILIQVPDTTDTIDLDVNGRIFQVADGFVDISTNSLDVTERTAPAATANQAKLYSKDVATVTHMFVIDSAGVETDLTVAGASANQQLSNLVATVAINLTLLPSSDGAVNVGSAGVRFGTGHFDILDLQDDQTAQTPGSAVTSIRADTLGMNFGVPDVGDTYDFFFNGVSSLQIKEDGELQFNSSGKLHKIVPQTTSLDIVAELATDNVEITNAPRAFKIAEFGDFITRFRTKSTTDTSPYELLFKFENLAPEGLTDPNIANITWEGVNSVDTVKTYVQVQAGIDDATATSEDGFFEVFVLNNNSLVKSLDLDASGGSLRTGFFGTNAIAQPSHIADPTGGAVIDAEARTAINSILADLASLGLQASS